MDWGREILTLEDQPKEAKKTLPKPKSIPNPTLK